MPKVSVCIPVYNVEQYIGRCLESVLSQSLKDIDVVVVNDCTPDKSMEIVERYAENDARIKLLNHSENHGSMVARHTAYMVAESDYITFLDSDDTLAEGALENLYNAAVRTQADIVSGVIEYIPMRGARYLWKNKLLYGSDKISVFKSLLKDEFGHNLCSRLFRRNLLQNYTYETFKGATNGEDGILFYQVVDNAKKIVTIDEVVYEYYQNMASSSNVRLTDRALKSISILNSVRVQVVGQYPELRELVSQKVSGVLLDLRVKGYNIDEVVAEQNLELYLKASTFRKNHGLRDLIISYIKLLYRRIRKV